MKKYVFLIPVLLILYLLTLNFSKESIKKEKDLNKEIKKEIYVNLTLDDKNEELKLEEYILGVVACEMPASFNYEALKAMAVASRTYALSREKDEYIYMTLTDQCYNNTENMKEKWKEYYDKYYEIISKAVEETKGEYISYNNKPIKAFYFANSNGYTEDVKNVFQEDLSYLESVSSPWDIDTSAYLKEKTFTLEEIQTKLNVDKIEDINILSRNLTNRVEKVSVNNTVYTGVEFRKLLGLRSTDFDIKINTDNITITTRGYGHGVGMSQYGANGMAKAGYSYKEILKYYYKDVEILMYKF